MRKRAALSRSIVLPLLALLALPGCIRDKAKLSQEEFNDFLHEIEENDGVPDSEEVRESFTDWAEEQTPLWLEFFANDPRFSPENFNEFMGEYREGSYTREEARETVEDTVEARFDEEPSAQDTVVLGRESDEDDAVHRSQGPQATAVATWAWIIDVLTMFAVGLGAGLLWWTVRRPARRV